jgi:hypothetical protein
MEYEQHCGGFVQSGVLGPRRTGFKYKPANNPYDLNNDLVLSYPFKISLILLTSDVKQLMSRIVNSLNYK